MGVSIDLYVFNADELLKALEAWGANDRELTHKILEECGMFAEGNYIILNNEYGEGSPYYHVAALLNAAFKKSDLEDDSFDIFLGREGVSRRRGISYVDLEEAAEELGIELPEEDDE